MTYTITVLPDTQESKYQVMAQAGEACHNIVRHVLGKPSGFNPQRELLLIEDLLSTRYWGVLSALDGPSPDGFYQFCVASDFEKLRPARLQAQRWAQDNFPIELEKILNVIVNQALLQPIKTHRPGNTLGNAHIYDQLVFNPYSLFKDALTPELKDRLNNGRFWECIPQANSGLFLGVVADSLNQGELSLDFIPQGIKLMKASNDDRPLHDLRLELLEDDVLTKYFSFLEKAYLKGKGGEDLYPLVREGVFGLVGWNFEMDEPYVSNFRKQLKGPFLQMYLSASPELRSDLAWEMQHQFGDDTYRSFQRKVISAIPNPEEFTKLLSRERGPE